MVKRHVAGSSGPVSRFTLRISEIVTIITARVFDDSLTALNTPAFDTHIFSRFTLYLDILSAGTPTTMQFIVQFSDDAGTHWFDYKQGLFASLFYEDTDTATVVRECFSGECAGRLFRLRAVGTGTGANDTFLVTSRVEFFN